MSADDARLDDLLAERKALFDRFGGLPETTVQNTEWLYMLEQDTRHSLAIEGYFTSEEELEAVLAGKRSNVEVTNYFRTAQTVYDQALQYFREHSLRLDLPLVRHLHSELFRNTHEQRGQFRKGAIRINRAPVRPPEFDVEVYVRAALQLMLADLDHLPILTALARAHALFESIHPFPDGNGRAGRILLNYLAISCGYPPIIIKGVQQDERQRYYAALEAADVGFHAGFPEEITPEALGERLTRGNLAPLRRLLLDGLQPRLDRLLVLAVKTQAGLMTLPELAERLGVQEPALRKRIERGTLLTIKEGGRVYSHPALALSGRPQPGASAALAFTSSGWLTARATMLAPQPLTVALPDGTPLDAGTVTLEGAAYHIAPPAAPMVDQLLTWLDTQPSQHTSAQARHMGVGMAALCVRWGSYLATLLDPDAPLHPDLAAGAATGDLSLIDQSEMRRMNIEVSYAIARLAGIYHERGAEGLEDMLSRAYHSLPMPQQSVPINPALRRAIQQALLAYELFPPEPPVASVRLEDADRVIANALALQSWRNTLIEDIHAGHETPHPLLPYQRRMRPREASQLLREVSGNLASCYFWFETLFSAKPTPGLPQWPETATALALSFAGMSTWGWSLADTSAPVTLPQ